MKEFKLYFIWGMNVKFFMGLYFAALVFLSGILIAIFGGDSLHLITLLQMLLLSLVLALLQVFIIPDSTDFSRGIFFARSILWLLLAMVITVAVAFWGGWFPGMPSWCPWLMGVLMLCGCTAMLLGQKFEQDADTVRLNKSLDAYQHSK